jgi:hypothetical protein
LGLDLSSTIFRVASLMGLACSPLPAPPQATLPLEEPPRQLPIGAERSAAVPPAAAEETLVKNQLFLLQSARAELVLRGYESKFDHQLASQAQHVLYDAALELVWFSGERRLWVVDLRESTLAAMRPVLIANWTATRGSRASNRALLARRARSAGFILPTRMCLCHRLGHIVRTPSAVGRRCHLRHRAGSWC